MDSFGMTDTKPLKIEKAYNSIILFFSAVFFGYLVFRIFVPSTAYNNGVRFNLKLFVAAILSLAAIWLLTWYVKTQLDKSTSDTAVVFFIFINLVLQLICIFDLRVSPTWDFKEIMRAADDIAKGKAIGNITYYAEYPYNLNTAVIVGTFKYLAGNTEWAPYFLNILAVTASITGTCLVVRRISGPQAAVITGIFCAAATPLYLYVPIVYTDTLSMPFFIWSIYFWSLIRQQTYRHEIYHYGKKAESLRILLFYSAIGILSAVGYLIKPIAAIGLIAIVLECLLAGRSIKLHRFQRALAITAAMAAAVISVLAFRLFIDFKGYTSKIDYNKSIPFTHWLMMGMNTPPTEGGTSSGYGGFSLHDLTYTRSFPTKQKKQDANLLVIRERLNNFGLKGYVQFLLKKVEWTWTDGTYYAPVKLARHPLKLTRLSTFILPNKDMSNRLYMAYAKLSQLTLLLLIFSGCIFAMTGKNAWIYRPMAVMCLGLMAFLLLWESRSRYLVTMIPVFIVMATVGAEMTYSFIYEYVKRRRNRIT